jgi:hypothetical protein
MTGVKVSEIFERSTDFVQAVLPCHAADGWYQVLQDFGIVSRIGYCGYICNFSSNDV